MTLAVLLLVAIATAGIVIALTWRWAVVVAPNPPSAMGAARKAGRAMRRHPGTGSALATRLDPRAATGLGLTLALADEVARFAQDGSLGARAAASPSRSGSV
jgi:hypothetical protein